MDIEKENPAHGGGGKQQEGRKSEQSTYREEGGVGGQSEFDAVVVKVGISALGALRHRCRSGRGGEKASTCTQGSLELELLAPASARQEQRATRGKRRQRR